MVRGPLKHIPTAHLTCGIHISILTHNLNVTLLFLNQLLRIINALGFFHLFVSNTVNSRSHSRAPNTGDWPIKGPVSTHKATQKTRHSSTTQAKLEPCVRGIKGPAHFRSLEHSVLTYARYVLVI